MVSLNKGEKISLDKTVPGLVNVKVGLGWSPSTRPGVEFDLDASAFLLASNGKIPDDAHFIFYNNKVSPDASVTGADDDRTGGSSTGDDEEITINLSMVSSQIERIVIVVTIHDATARSQSFGDVKDSYVRVLNMADGSEIVRYDLTGDYSKADAVIFGELGRVPGGWDFTAIGDGSNAGLSGLCKQFGVNVS